MKKNILEERALGFSWTERAHSAMHREAREWSMDLLSVDESLPAGRQTKLIQNTLKAYVT